MPTLPATSTAPEIPTATANAVTADNVKQWIADAISANNVSSNTRGGKRRRETEGKTKPKAQVLIDGFPCTYCWTHGITSNLQHTSATCTRPKQGHKKEATYENKMGGSEEVCKPRK